MKPDTVLNHFGVKTQTALAAHLGRPVSTVAEWFQRDCIPRAVQWELEVLTNGQLRAERPQMRPRASS